MEVSKEKIEEAVSSIIAKAKTDIEFRKRTIDNPKEVLSEIFGQELPEDFKIEVIETKPDVNLTIILPSSDNKDLREEELKNISGGYNDDSPNLKFVNEDPILGG